MITVLRNVAAAAGMIVVTVVVGCTSLPTTPKSVTSTGNGGGTGTASGGIGVGTAVPNASGGQAGAVVAATGGTNSGGGAGRGSGGATAGDGGGRGVATGGGGGECAANGASCSALADGTPIAWPTGTPVGICKYGHLACAGNGSVQCVGAVAPGKRSCSSAMDNDCDDQPDNTVDTTCQCAAGMTYPCTGPAPNNCAGTRSCDTTNPASFQLGTCNAPTNCQCTSNTDTRTCGGAACQTIQTCQADGTWPACSLPANCACSGSQTATCTTATNNCPGTKACSNYQWATCQSNGPCKCTNGMTSLCNGGDCNESMVTCVSNVFPSCPSPVVASACTSQAVIEGTTQSCGGATTCPGVACPAPSPALCSINGCPGYSCGDGCNPVQTPKTFTVGGTLPSTSSNGLAATFTGCTIAFADFPAPPPPSMPAGAYNISYAISIRGTASCSSGTRYIEQFSCSSTVPGGGACSNYPSFCEGPCGPAINSGQNFIFDANDFLNGATGTLSCPPSDTIILTHLQKDTTSCTYTATVTSVTWTYTVCE